MQYVALFVAFLCEMTAYPTFIKNSLHIESITLTYFVIILATNKKVSVIFPVILLIISSIVTARIAGLSSFLILVGAFAYYQFFVANERSKFTIKKPTYASAIIGFSILFLIISIVKIVILYSFGYSISPLLEFFTYIINIAIFIILTICVL
jgi:hypothetical protein